MPSFRFIAVIHAFLVHSFFAWDIFTMVTTIISCALRHVFLQRDLNNLTLHSSKNKSKQTKMQKTNKKHSRDLSFNRMNNFEKLYPKK